MMALEEQVGKKLLAHGLTLATAESCTGGLVGHLLTNIPGSSVYYLGGVVSYANSAKVGLLGVAEQTLLDFGAVSAETALEMARGVRARLGTDLGVSVTGIAGPGGGTPQKPVGLVWIGLSAPWEERAVCYTWQGDRVGNKEASAQAALALVLETLELHFD